jgi:hypothetical protein
MAMGAVSKKPNITPADKRRVAIAKAQGKTWAEIEDETGLGKISISRILRDDDTKRFIAELRGKNAAKLSAIYDLVLDTTIRDLKACKDPRTASSLRRHAITLLTMETSARGGDRSRDDTPLVSIDNRQLPPEGLITLKELILATRQTKEEIN